MTDYQNLEDDDEFTEFNLPEMPQHVMPSGDFSDEEWAEICRKEQAILNDRTLSPKDQLQELWELEDEYNDEDW